MQREVGVLVHESQKINIQIQQVIRKANRMLSLITSGIGFKSREIMLRLCRAPMRPCLEFCVQHWYLI